MANVQGTNGNDLITGSLGNDVLNGLAGADTLRGGRGNDTYHVDNLGDTITELSGEGEDTIVSTIAFGSAYSNVENYDFSKLAVGVNFTGSALDNIIKGGAGTDTLAGGLGNDTYFLNRTQDVVVEASGAGTDTIAVGFSADLADYVNIENIRLRGSAALNANGNAVANALYGNSGANILDGKGGADTLSGGKGNDVYRVDHIGDQVIESAGQGIDRIVSGVSWTISDHVENLTLAAGTGNTYAVGNELNNVIVGNEGANELDGRGGADTMKGGKGNDIYWVTQAGDKAVELAGQGTDRVNSTIDFSLAAAANVEELRLWDSAIKGTGNTLGNLIIGNANANILDGGKGADTLRGRAGDDTYHVDNLGDLIEEDVSDGADTIVATVALTQGVANVENYDFTGCATAVNFTGTDSPNQIRSSAFADTLAGGQDGDTYFLNNAGDRIVELAGGGTTDTAYVNFSVSKLWDEVEVLYFSDQASTKAWNATGNETYNDIFGNEGQNVLKGAGGHDELSGYGGNDTLSGGSGDDNLYGFSGRDRLVGGEGDDWLDGDLGNDTLLGGGGDDILTGRAGDDTMTGGAGADRFVFAAGDPVPAHDVITDFDRDLDILSFLHFPDTDGDGTDEPEDVVAAIVDQGLGRDVVVHLQNGGLITFKGIGAGTIDSLDDLVADPASQIIVS